MKALNIYIRTSLTGPCIKDGCWAAAIEYQTRKGPAVKGICGAEKETTYYRLVLLGIVESLKTLNTACHVTLYTDCIFIKNMIENGKPSSGNGQSGESHLERVSRIQNYGSSIRNWQNGMK